MLPSADPYACLTAWLHDAESTEPRVPEAMQLATADAQGRPSIRTVLLKGWNAVDGLVFYTNYGSRKARQLEENAFAAGVLHFKGLERQVIAEGSVTRTPEPTSDAYFAERPRGSQLGAWASKQSAPLGEAHQLNTRMRQVEERFKGQAVPRPPFWGGYQLHPIRFEFWQGRPDRLHDRVLFLWEGTDWSRTVLYP